MSGVLYFQGLSGVKCGSVENSRLCAAFHLNDGQPVYIQLAGWEVEKKYQSKYPYKHMGFVEFCFYIIGDDDVNEHRVPGTCFAQFEYTDAGILHLVNSLGCSFDAIRVSPEFGGYKVSKGSSEYRFSEDFRPDMTLTAREEKIYQYFYDQEKKEGEEYPTVRVWSDGDDIGLLHGLRFMLGGNRHWIIRADVPNWMETMKETTLGEYGC